MLCNVSLSIAVMSLYSLLTYISRYVSCISSRLYFPCATGTVVLLGRDHAAERLQLDQWRAQMRRQHQLQLQKKQLGKAFSNGQLTRSMSGSALERRQQSKSKSVNVTKSKNSSKDKNADSALENKDVSVLNLKTKAPVFSLDKEVAEEQDNVQAKDSECKDRDKILGNNDEKGQEKGKHIAGVKTRGKTKGDADIRLPGSALVFKEIWKACLPFPICSLVYGRHLQSAQFLWPSCATSADGTCNAQKPAECNSNSGHGGWQVPNTLTVTTTKTVHVLVRRKQ